MIRLREKNLKALQPLADLGLSTGELVNDVLETYLKESVQKRIQTLKSQLAKV